MVVKVRDNGVAEQIGLSSKKRRDERMRYQTFALVRGYYIIGIIR